MRAETARGLSDAHKFPSRDEAQLDFILREIQKRAAWGFQDILLDENTSHGVLEELRKLGYRKSEIDVIVRKDDPCYYDENPYTDATILYRITW